MQCNDKEVDRHLYNCKNELMSGREKGVDRIEMVAPHFVKEAQLDE